MRPCRRRGAKAPVSRRARGRRQVHPWVSPRGLARALPRIHLARWSTRRDAGDLVKGALPKPGVAPRGDRGSSSREPPVAGRHRRDRSRRRRARHRRERSLYRKEVPKCSTSSSDAGMRAPAAGRWWCTRGSWVPDGRTGFALRWTPRAAQNGILPPRSERRPARSRDPEPWPGQGEQAGSGSGSGSGSD